MKTLTEFQLGYVAATIDCEGTISLGRAVDRSGYLHHTCNVCVGNTNIHLLIYLREITGIGIISPPRKNGEKGKLSKDWRLRIDEIKEFLPIIESVLVLKREQARLMLEYMSTIKANSEYNQVDYEAYALRNIIYYQMKELNRKGI